MHSSVYEKVFVFVIVIYKFKIPNIKAQCNFLLYYIFTPRLYNPSFYYCINFYRYFEKLESFPSLMLSCTDHV